MSEVDRLSLLLELTYCTLLRYKLLMEYNWSRYLVRWSDTIEVVIVTLGNVLLGYHGHEIN
jgi:hypothetical protein